MKIVHVAVAIAVSDDNPETPNMLSTVADAMAAGVAGKPGVVNYSVSVSHVTRDASLESLYRSRGHVVEVTQ